jgi:hypothetical protein
MSVCDFQNAKPLPIVTNISKAVGVICLVNVVLCVAVNWSAQNQINHVGLEIALSNSLEV